MTSTDSRRSYRTEDYHTGGEPFRIVVEGGPDLPGDTVAARRAAAIHDDDAQFVRALLCSEPRGHADMYGGFLTPADDKDGHLGVLFWHKDGFSTACGHGTIALGVWAVESGLVQRQDSGATDVVIDVPSGRVRARVRFEAGEIADVTFINVASWAGERGVQLETSAGQVAVDLGFGGAFYAVLPAAAVGLSVEPRCLPRLIELGREIKAAAEAAGVVTHPSDERLSGCYGVIFTDEPPHDDTLPEGSLHQRNVVIFADGEVDRSPCGSGTAARVALLAADGLLPDGRVLVHQSIVGSRFIARAGEHTTVDGRPAVRPEITGTAYAVGRTEFTVDTRDDLVPGFVLR
ncbi:proline racemase family protein [Actinomycetota bacterium]